MGIANNPRKETGLLPFWLRLPRKPRHLTKSLTALEFHYPLPRRIASARQSLRTSTLPETVHRLFKPSSNSIAFRSTPHLLIILQIHRVDFPERASDFQLYTKNEDFILTRISELKEQCFSISISIVTPVPLYYRNTLHSYLLIFLKLPWGSRNANHVRCAGTTAPSYPSSSPTAFIYGSPTPSTIDSLFRVFVLDSRNRIAQSTSPKSGTDEYFDRGP